MNNAFSSTAAAEQLGLMSKSSVDAMMKFASVGFESAERLFALNMEAAKVGLDVSAKNAKAVAGVKDLDELNTLRTKATEVGVEFASGYSKNFYNVAVAAQSQYTALVEERVSALQKSMVDTLDQVSKSAPAGSDVFVTAMKTGLAAGTAATDNLTKAAKQATAFAENAFKVAAETAEKATKTPVKRK
jgi:phasin family protein